MVEHLFLQLSGENPTLPIAEAKAILEAEGFKYQIIEELPHVLRLKASTDCVKPLKQRASMTKVCCKEILSCKANNSEMLESIEKVDFSRILGEDESFAVRISRVRGSMVHIEAAMLERKIGERIFENAEESKVNLKAPEKTFFGVLTGDRFVFGLRLAEIKHGDLIKRGPRRRVFFHPAAMPAKIARCMVNLSGARQTEVFLDPYCGTGSFLIEAALMGCRIVGSDVEHYMVRGTQRNLEIFGLQPEGLAVADAQLMPLAEGSVDRIAGDPPYGTSATTLGLTPKVLVEHSFKSFYDILKENGRVCLAAPKSIGVSELGKKAGFHHLESHLIYVHSTLTREIAVFKLKQ